MKKVILTVCLFLGMTMGAIAQTGGGLFQRGNTPDNASGDGGSSPMLPAHGQNTNQPANAPLGSGAMLLIGFGAAYALAKKKEK